MGRQEQIIEERLRKIKEMREAGIDPYPNKFSFKNYSSDIKEEHATLENGQHTKSKVSIAGRVMSVRDMGKIAFAVVQDAKGTIQLVFQEKETPKEALDVFYKYVDAGDFIGIEGTVFRTQRGEFSILVKSIQILTKSILPLPEKWHGLQDTEERLRKRYLDIIMNPEIKARFIRKAKFWNTIRSFLLERDFLEVETPVLEVSAGGAAATPFKTHHNALDQDVYLRISMGELWQKKLMVAGYGKTFEIGRQFRNEGMDAEHLQDYGQMEFYWGYANYEDGMKLVEEMYKEIAKKVYNKTVFEVDGHKIDINKKWEIIDYATEIKKKTGIDIWNASKEEMKTTLEKLKEEVNPGADRGRLMDLLWKYCRKKISGPAFLVGQPVEVTPLAKRDAKDSRKVQQFQVILGGTEMGNGYSELNDPIDQEERFKEQRKLKEAGDAEAHEHDESFVEALKYGMPPTCGFGFSERLFSFFEGVPIRECVIFPLMKPETTSTKENSPKKLKNKK